MPNPYDNTWRVFKECQTDRLIAYKYYRDAAGEPCDKFVHFDNAKELAAFMSAVAQAALGWMDHNA